MIKTGSYVGNGSVQFIECDFCPDFVIVKGGSNAAMIRCQDDWVQRSLFCTATASAIGGIVRRPGHAGFWVGSHASVNTLATTYFYLALAKSASLPIADSSWMGNGAAGHVVPLRDAAVTPAACIIKRDGVTAAIWCSVAGTNLQMSDGAAAANCVSAFGAGSVTLGTSASVNELTPPTSGEGTDGIFFQAGTAVVIGSYTGDGTSSKTIPLAFNPKALFIQGASIAAHIATDTMAGSSGPVGANAMSAGTVTLGTLGFTLNLATLNGNGVVHYYVAIADHSTDTQAALPNIITTGRKAVHLYSREIASYIDCGQSDTLKPAADNLPMTLEWFGALEWLDTARTASGALMIRGGTSQALGDVANSHQMGILALAPDDSALNWAGPQIGVVVADRYLRAGEIQKTWRTGILIPHGEFHHWLVTGDGNGKWRLYRDGALCKHRNLDMRTSSLVLANSKALTARAMVFGAVDDAGTKVSSQRMTIISARYYSTELTAAQALQRFSYECLGTGSDYTTGLVEEWLGTNAHGGVLPATVASANNGTITGGVVLTL